MTTPPTDWLVADDVWWGRRIGPAALPLAGGDVVGSPVAVARLPAGAPVRRLPGTLLPGLCDAHVYSARVDLVVVRAAGIAAVWDLGGAPARVAALRERSLAEVSPLPRVTMAGPLLTAPGDCRGDLAWVPAAARREIRSVTDAADAVAELAALRVGLVSVVLAAEGPVLSPAAVRTIVSEAHVRSLPVIVHADGSAMVAAAVDAGADLLARTPATEPLDRALVRTAAEQMTWLSTLDRLDGEVPGAQRRQLAVGNLRRFLGYGGNVRYGTDPGGARPVGTEPGDPRSVDADPRRTRPAPADEGVNRREIRALQEAGMSPEQILHAMTGDRAGVPPCWVPGGLDLDPARFADVLATVRVVGPQVRPR
ncbi:MAG TPA: amidohydrolase [Actinoplanes sp.]|nr:amidohydrolase [Actinoplanes sp.]